MRRSQSTSGRVSQPNASASRACRLTSTTATGAPKPDADASETLRRLLALAITAPPSERVDLYRERLAEGGPAVVDLLLQLEVERPHLGLFAIAVLEAVAKRNVVAAQHAIRLLITTAADPSTRAQAADTIDRLESPRPVAKSHAQAPSPTTPLDLINLARRKRGEPILDAAEARKVLNNLAAREQDPRRYRKWCWSCRAVVDEATNEQCAHCTWLVCWCGACRDPGWTDSLTGQIGPCRREVWFLADNDTIAVDTDFQGLPILTTQPPAAAESDIAAALRTGGVDAVYHWTPLRGVASILRWSILSRRALLERTIPFVGHGYGNQDKARLLSAYVCLSFAPKPWMMEEWSQSPVLLELVPEVLLGNGTLFVPGNSASAMFSSSSLASMIGLPAAEALFLSGRVVTQAEAWVRASVPRVGIRAIHVADKIMARNVAVALSVDLPKDAVRPIRVSPSYFASPDTPDLS